MENMDRSQLKIGIWGGKSNLGWFSSQLMYLSLGYSSVSKTPVTKLYSLSLSWLMHTFSLFSVTIYVCPELAGYVVLQDLVLKQSALDDLDLPVKTTFGTLGTQSLYNLCIKLMNIYFILKYPLYCTYNMSTILVAKKESKWLAFCQ